MLDTKALAEATAVIVREHVKAAVAPLIARIAELEAREPLKGDPGERGEKGEPGADGAPGRDADMEDVKALVVDEVAKAISGLPGPERGEAGPQGEKGERGADGAGIADLMQDHEGNLIASFTDGRMKNIGPVRGRDGRDGVDGKDGTDGQDGAPGRDGQDGKNGLDVTDIEITQDGAVLEMAFQVGEVRSIFEVELPQGPAGVDGRDAYPGEAKGFYDPNGKYRALDVVSFNGSEWRAKYDEPGPLPGDGWMLSACRGKRGEKGERGPEGKEGTSVVAHYVRGAELVTTLSDGAEIVADLSGLGGAE